MALPTVVVLLLLALGCSALPRRRLSKHISHYDVAKYDKQSVHEAHSRFSQRWHNGETDPFEFRMTITSHGRIFHLELHPDEEVFTSETQFLGDNDQPIHFDRASVLVGRVAGEEGSSVYGSILEGRFRGVISAHGEKYSVDPVMAHFDEPQSFHSVMYKDSDVAHDKLMEGWERSQHALEVNRTSDDEEEESNSTGGGEHHKLGDNPWAERAHRRARRQSDADQHLECRLNMGADHTYSAEVARLEAYSITDERRVRAAVVQTFALYVRQANEIFTQTKFSASATKAEGYRVAIQLARAYINVAEMKTFRAGTILTSGQTSANAVLRDWSKISWDSYCLSYLFVHRDFDGSVLGLAYVSQICSSYSTSKTPPSTNTGTVTSINAGQRLPSSTIALVFVHELGHNWGTNHDPATTECSPADAKGGRYIMATNANSGNLPNHYKFSPCSIRSIASIVSKFKNRCFKPPSRGQICGNNVKEGTEECDCGGTTECTAVNLCCNKFVPASQNNCKRRTGDVCSVQDGPCCAQTGNGACTLTPMAANHTCTEHHECRIGTAVCDGTSAKCPRAPSRPNGTICNGNRSTCDRGDCNATLCALANLKECFCTGVDACAVCCLDGNKCTPLRNIKNRGVNHVGLSNNLLPGSPCNNYKGHCNFLNFCRRLDDTSLLGSIATTLFNLSTFESAWTWAKANWYYVLLGFFGIILFFALIIHFFAKKTPRTIEVHRRSMRNANKKTTENLELVGRQ